MIRKVSVLKAVIAVMAVIAFSVGLLELNPAAAQEEPSASRLFSADPVDAGGEVTVTITADGYGSFGDVAETLPAGFTYSSSSLPDDQVTRDGQTVKFALIGGTPPTTFTYTVTVSSVEGDHSFTGVFSGVVAGFIAFSGVQVDGDSSITVAATTTPPDTGDGDAGDGDTGTTPPDAGEPSASRLFSADPVDAGGEVTVTITADGYGSFGDVAETLPAGFTYSSSSLPDDQVTRDGQTVKFALIGGTPPTTFTYTVTVSSVEGDHSFTGVFSGVVAGFIAFSGVQVGGASSITVEATTPSGPSASRLFSADPVDAGSEVTVTITADGYGSFGDVAETLPAGFTYSSSSLPDDQVESVGQTVTLSLVGADSPTTFTYTVTASSVEGDHSFTGVFSGVDADFDAFDGVQVGGDSSIAVGPAAGPSASRSFSPDPVDAGGEVTVTITAEGHGSFADVAETLPAGFTYSASSLPDDQVESVGQTVTLSLVGATSPTTFTYTVTASSVEADHSFTGDFSGVDTGFDAFSGVRVGGDSSIRVGAEATPTPKPSPTATVDVGPKVSWNVPQALSLNVMIRPISPIIDDNDIASYTISKGRLPRNLRLDEKTGYITGRPVRESSAATTVTIKVIDRSGNEASVDLRFPPVRDRTVEEDAPTPTLPDVPPLDLSGVTVGDAAPSSGLQLALAATGGALLLGGIGVMTARRRIRARVRR